MDFILSDRVFRINRPEEIATPALVLFYDRFVHNLKKMRKLLAEVDSAYTLKMLCPHVKTHKSEWITRQMIGAGIEYFKASPNEVDMLISAGAKKIFVAYPLIGHQLDKIARLVKKHRDIRFYVQASRDKHIEYLKNAADKYDVVWNFYIDVDVGMHRTGIEPERIIPFYFSIPSVSSLSLAGLHAYDGHNTSSDEKVRREETKRVVDRLAETVHNCREHHIEVDEIMIGGTPSFLIDLEYLHNVKLDVDIRLSPGTWVYFDSKQNTISPGTFEVAVYLLAQVMDKPSSDIATLNIGHKRWAVDQGPAESFSISHMRALSWSEEHTVVNAADSLAIGDYVLFAPRHVCSTVNLWEKMTVVDASGEVIEDAVPIDARNR